MTKEQYPFLIYFIVIACFLSVSDQLFSVCSRLIYYTIGLSG